MDVGLQSKNRGIYINATNNFMFLKRNGTRDGLLSDLNYIDFYNKLTEKENLENGYIISVSYKDKEFRDIVFLSIINNINESMKNIKNLNDALFIDLDKVENEVKKNYIPKSKEIQTTCNTW